VFVVKGRTVSARRFRQRRPDPQTRNSGTRGYPQRSRSNSERSDFPIEELGKGTSPVRHTALSSAPQRTSTETSTGRILKGFFFLRFDVTQKGVLPWLEPERGPAAQNWCYPRRVKFRTKEADEREVRSSFPRPVFLGLVCVWFSAYFGQACGSRRVCSIVFSCTSICLRRSKGLRLNFSAERLAFRSGVTSGDCKTRWSGVWVLS
jgi:hypothetical protein